MHRGFTIPGFDKRPIQSVAERLPAAVRVDSTGFGTGGMWAGCATASLLASPSLVIPLVGEVTTGGACMVGGILGGLGFGWFGRKFGEAAGEEMYHLVVQMDEFHWVSGR